MYFKAKSFRFKASIVMSAAATLISISLLVAQQKPAGGAPTTDADVTRATLDNGMRVVIIRDPLAPVVTVEENYLAGGDETPAGFPGWRTRRSTWRSADARGYRRTRLRRSSRNWAATETRTRSRTSRSISRRCRLRTWTWLCAWTRPAWKTSRIRRTSGRTEKGAIEQEVARDLSNPTYKFITRLNEDLFSGTRVQP